MNFSGEPSKKSWIQDLVKDLKLPLKVASSLAEGSEVGNPGELGSTGSLSAIAETQKPLGMKGFEFSTWKKGFDDELKTRSARVLYVWDLLSENQDHIMDPMAIEEAQTFFLDGSRQWKISLLEGDSSGIEFGVEEAGKGLWKLSVDSLGLIKCSAKGYLPLFLLWHLINQRKMESEGFLKISDMHNIASIGLILKSYFFEMACLNRSIERNLSHSNIDKEDIADIISGAELKPTTDNYGFDECFYKSRVHLKSIIIAPVARSVAKWSKCQTDKNGMTQVVGTRPSELQSSLQDSPIYTLDANVAASLLITNEDEATNCIIDNGMNHYCSYLVFQFSDGTLISGAEIFRHAYGLLVPRFFAKNGLGIEPGLGQSGHFNLRAENTAETFSSKIDRESLALESEHEGIIKNLILKCLLYGEKYQLPVYFTDQNSFLQKAGLSQSIAAVAVKEWSFLHQKNMSRWEVQPQTEFVLVHQEKSNIDGEVLVQGSCNFEHLKGATIDFFGFYIHVSSGALLLDSLDAQGQYLTDQLSRHSGGSVSKELLLENGRSSFRIIGHEAINRVIWPFQDQLYNRFGVALDFPEGERLSEEIIQPEIHLFHKSSNHLKLSFLIDHPQFQMRLWNLPADRIENLFLGLNSGLGGSFQKSGEPLPLSYRANQKAMDLKIFRHVGFYNFLIYEVLKWKSGQGLLVERDGASTGNLTKEQGQSISGDLAASDLSRGGDKSQSQSEKALSGGASSEQDRGEGAQNIESPVVDVSQEEQRKVEKWLLNRGALLFLKILKKSASKEINQYVGIREKGMNGKTKEGNLKEHISEKALAAVENWMSKELGWARKERFYLFYKNITMYINIENLVDKALLALVEVNVRDLGKNSFLNQSFKNRKIASVYQLGGFKFSGKNFFDLGQNSDEFIFLDEKVNPSITLDKNKEAADQANKNSSNSESRTGDKPDTQESEIMVQGTSSEQGPSCEELNLVKISPFCGDILLLPKAKRHLLLNEAQNFDFYVGGKAVEALQAEDFVTELNIGEDATGKIDWFDLDPKTFFKGKEVSKEITASLADGPLMLYEGHYYLLNKKEIPSLKWLDFFWDQLHSGEKTKSKKTKEDKIYKLPKSQVLDMLALRHTGVQVNGGEKWNQICLEFDRLSQNIPLEEREGYKDIDELGIPFKNYQKLGVLWLYDLFKLNLGGILADDMGLGKTVQMLGLFELLRRKSALGINLVVVPTSLIYNWEFEIKKFTPKLPYIFFESSEKAELEKKWHDKKNGPSETIVITSYGLLNNHIEFFLQFEWNTVIFDEAQNLKNISAKRTTSARRLRAHSKFCLTGTPMENHYGEFFSLLDLVVPGSLGLYSDFIAKYSLKPGSDGQSRWTRQDIEFLRLKTKPLILRRAKTSILTELPEKTETVIKLPLEKEQERIYKDIAISWNKRVHNAIDSKGESKSQLEMLTALLRLRQVCSYPAIVPNVIYDKRPPKVELILEAAKELLDHGESLLVFTNFLSTLEYLKSEFSAAGLEYLTLMGSMPSRERAEVLQRFSESSRPKILLMTLKVGGVGLNLTKASYVFHIEPWWNPAAENQATDRVHRLGQKKAVQVYRYIMEKSVEEKIQTLKKRKGLAFDALFAEKIGDLEELRNSSVQGSKLTKEDFEHLLQETTY